MVSLIGIAWHALSALWGCTSRFEEELATHVSLMHPMCPCQARARASRSGAERALGHLHAAARPRRWPCVCPPLPMTVSAPEPTPAGARAERIAAAGARRAALSVRSARVAGTAGLGGQRRADPAVRPRRGDKATHVGALSQGADESGALQLHASRISPHPAPPGPRQRAGLAACG